jgi:hypothetical protein
MPDPATARLSGRVALDGGLFGCSRNSAILSARNENGF